MHRPQAPQHRGVTAPETSEGGPGRCPEDLLYGIAGGSPGEGQVRGGTLADGSSRGGGVSGEGLAVFCGLLSGASGTLAVLADDKPHRTLLQGVPQAAQNHGLLARRGILPAHLQWDRSRNKYPVGEIYLTRLHRLYTGSLTLPQITDLPVGHGNVIG